MAAWKTNRRFVSLGYPELRHVPLGRSGWDATISCMAYAARMEIGGAPDLAAWAARHAVPASARFAGLEERALVLWHGTSRARAEKIAEHGLFHKKGLWTAIHPCIPHGFCRSRSELFGDEGAVICIVVDRAELVEGRDYEAEGDSGVIRFKHGLPPEVVEYVLVHDGVRFTGRERARLPAPWPAAAFKRSGGRWVPAQKPPVRYSAGAGYSTPREFVGLCVRRLLDELGDVTALEAFSSVYAAARPWDVVTHSDILDALSEACRPPRARGKWRVFAGREGGGA